MAIRPFTTILAAGAALIAGFAAAQGPQQGTPARVGQRAGPQAPGPVEQGADGPIVSIEFKGGTLGDLVRSLQAQGKDPVNIALQGDAAAIPVERMALRNVTVHSALEAALGSRINTVLFEADGTSKQITLEQLAGNGDAAAVFVITRHETQARQMGREPSVQVFSIQKLVSGSGAMPPEVVLTAIDTGLGLQTRAEGARPQIKFHKDSGLLLVRGEGMDVNLIEQIVSRLQKDHERQVAEESRRKAVEIDRATRRKKAESIIRENDAYIASSAEIAPLAPIIGIADAGSASHCAMAPA